MRIKFKGQYLGNYSGVPTVGEARVIKRELNMLPGDFEVALDGMDPDATSLLIAIMQARKSSEPIGDYAAIDCEYHDIEIEYTEAEQAEMTDQQRELIKKVKENGDKLRAASAAEGKGDAPAKPAA